MAGWFRYLSGEDEQGRPFPIEDPRLAELQARAREGGLDPRPLLSLTDLFGDLGQSEPFVRQLSDDLATLYSEGTQATLTRALT